MCICHYASTHLEFCFPTQTFNTYFDKKGSPHDQRGQQTRQQYLAQWVSRLTRRLLCWYFSAVLECHFQFVWIRGLGLIPEGLDFQLETGHISDLREMKFRLPCTSISVHLLSQNNLILSPLLHSFSLFGSHAIVDSYYLFLTNQHQALSHNFSFSDTVRQSSGTILRC